MKTTYYARNELNIGKTTIAKDAIVCTLETPDGVDVGRIINALHNGLLTSTAPKNTATTEGAAIPVAPVVPQIQTSAAPAEHPTSLEQHVAAPPAAAPKAAAPAPAPDVKK